MLKFTLLALLILSIYADQVPIPPRPDGFSRGSNTPTLHIEAYYDLLCPGSKSAWGIIEPLLNNDYHIDTNQTLRFTIHMFPLPYHINAFFTAQGANVIYDNLKDSDDIFKYLNLIFANQAKFSTPGTVDQSQNQVIQNLIDLVKTNMPAYGDIFAKGITSGTYNSEARMSWKYACYQGVTGAPIYFANGVKIDGAADFNGAQWKKFLNGSYLQKRKPTHF